MVIIIIPCLSLRVCHILNKGLRSDGIQYLTEVDFSLFLFGDTYPIADIHHLTTDLFNRPNGLVVISLGMPAIFLQLLSQIILESISLTLAAGSFGIVFAVQLLRLVNSISLASGDPGGYQIGFWTAIVAALLLTALGVVAGLAPASRAMAIKPVDAMRDE